MARFAGRTFGGGNRLVAVSLAGGRGNYRKKEGAGQHSAGGNWAGRLGMCATGAS